MKTAARSAFALLLASETAFDFGTALMTFALGVWIFQHTGSAQQFSGAILAATIPTLLVTPLAGALADAFDRRWVIAGCDAASTVLIAALAVLMFQERLALEQLYIFNASNAIIAAIRVPAYRAALGSIVPRDQLTQAGGLMGLSRSLLQIGAPLVAGYLMGAFGLPAVIGVQIILVIAGGCTAFRALTHARLAIRGRRARRATVFGEAAASFGTAIRYFREVPEMGVLAVYGAVEESLLVLAASMMIPLVLSSRSSDVVGLILSCGALGSLLGSAVLVIAPARRYLMRWILITNIAVSLFVLVTGLTTSTSVWSACSLGAYLAGTVSSACATALMLRKTPVAIRGSVFALNGALNGIMMCAAMLAGGYLAEHVFEPALADGGAWSNSVGAWIGTGKGRGLAFLFVACGAAGCALSLLALLPRRFRTFDELSLDPDDPSADGPEEPDRRAAPPDPCPAPPLAF